LGAATWDIVYSNVNNKKTKESLTGLYNNNKLEVISDPVTLSELFNEYFFNAPHNLRINSDLNKLDTCNINTNNNNMNSMYLEETNHLEVYAVIKSLKNSKAYDIFDISTHIIKTIVDLIVHPIVNVFNTAIQEGVFPDLLKISKINPVFKKGDKLDISNYRPISILPIISKIFEQIILVRLNKFLNHLNILSHSQHGFRQNRSTTTAIFDLTENIYPVLDKKATALGMFIDLSKAFDLVDHSILLTKLNNIGIRGVVLKLFVIFNK
jgi:hypothetical protein